MIHLVTGSLALFFFISSYGLRATQRIIVGFIAENRQITMAPIILRLISWKSFPQSIKFFVKLDFFTSILVVCFVFVAYFAKVWTLLSIYYFEHNVTAAEVELLKNKVADIIRLTIKFDRLFCCPLFLTYFLKANFIH